jgi:hypothetical protein
MNAVMERWIQSCRHEMPDRTLIWNQAHLLHALRQYEQRHNAHRPHRGIMNMLLELHEQGFGTHKGCQ